MNLIERTNINDRLYVIPQDPVNKTAMLSIDRHTKEDVRRKYGFYAENDWVCNTIANCYIEVIIRHLGLDVKDNGNADAMINMYDLYVPRITLKHNEDAEKEGNINIAFTNGPRVEELIKDTTPRDQQDLTRVDPSLVFSFEDKDRTEYYEKLDKVTRIELSRKYNITIPDSKVKFIATAIADRFIENLIRELLYMIANSENEVESINFNDNIECHAIKEEDNTVRITLRPGMNAKLLVKSDETTENDEV